MTRPILIIITGLPGTGKTTLGEKIAEKFELPFVSKDNLKELLFDNLGWSDREWSKKVGIASFALLYNIAGILLKSGVSFIVEANFKPEYDNKKFIELKSKYNFMPIQIRCITKGEILLKRFEDRANSQNRHQGHVDDKNIEEFRPILLKGTIEALDVGGKLYDIDTTTFDNISYDDLYKNIGVEIMKA